MINLTGIKQIFFGNLTTNNNTVPKKELNNFSLRSNPIYDTISFEGHRHYTNSQKKIMQTLRKIALDFKLPDFYTGKRFSKGHKPTIEHLIPYSEKDHAIEKGLTSINSLGNFVPIETEINSDRDSIPLKEWYKMHPDFLENGKKALNEYEKVTTPLINGKIWVKNLKNLLNGELGYVAFQGRKIKKDQKLSYVA